MSKRAKLFVFMRNKDFDEEVVLRKAIRLFWEKGYHNTSLQDLISGLGIGRSSIYHTYGDKHQLFVKALELYQQEGTAKISAIINSMPTLYAGIQKLLETVIDEVTEEICPKGCFSVNSKVEISANDEMVKQMVYDDSLLIEDSLRIAFEKAIEKKEIAPSNNPLALAHFFANTVTGMRVYAKFRNERQFFEDIATTALLTIKVFDQTDNSGK